MKRRDFFAAASSMLLPVVVNGFGVKSMSEDSIFVKALMKTAAAYNDRILVVIYLDGGNDGLNTVIPLDQYSAYTGLRGNIAIPENKILPIGTSGKTGFHPSMTGMRDLFNEGKLAVIHSVGYPNPNKSHYRSTDIYMTAVDSDKYSDTGWAGRYLMDRYPDYPENFPKPEMKDPLAIEIGSLARISSFSARQPMAINILGPGDLAGMLDTQESAYSGPVPCCESGELVKFVRQQQSLAVDYGQRIKTASDIGQNLASYSSSGSNYDLAEQLKIIARLIDGGLQSKIYFVSLSGFDTHAAQVTNSDNTVGDHAVLLKKLSESISSFQNDLKLQGREDRVIGMTFSDFGRRATSNASKGTDHGVAAPMFVFGTGIKRQEVGVNPDLTSGLLPINPSQYELERDVKTQIDFRRVYSDIFNDWFGTNSTTTDALLFKNFKTISLFSNVTETIATGAWPDKEIWSTGIVPTSKEYVKVNAGHTVSVGENVSVKNIQLDGDIIFLGDFDITITG